MDCYSRIMSHGGGSLEGHLRRGDGEGAGPREARIARLDGFASSALEQFEHRSRNLYAIAAQDTERVRGRGGIGHRRTRSNVDRSIAGYVRDQQSQHLRGVTSSSQ